jgi:predicted molibdopterin-dependent oxidoreductase YjgC
MRIEKAVKRGAPVTIYVDGEAVASYAGETVGAALLAAGIAHLRSSPGTGQPRGLFCLMGVCQECVVRIDERTATACTEAVRDGMRVTLDRSKR